MGAITFAEVLGWIRDLGSLAILSLIVWGAVQDWWIPGTHHRKVLEERDEQIRILRRERDEYRDITLDLLGMANRATAVADKVTTARMSRRPPRDALGRIEAERDVRRPPPS